MESKGTRYFAMSNEWFLRYRSEKGYIPARRFDAERYEVFGEYTKDQKSCKVLVRGLNAGLIKPIKRKIEKD